MSARSSRGALGASPSKMVLMTRATLAPTSGGWIDSARSNGLCHQGVMVDEAETLQLVQQKRVHHQPREGLMRRILHGLSGLCGRLRLHQSQLGQLLVGEAVVSATHGMPP